MYSLLLQVFLDHLNRRPSDICQQPDLGLFFRFNPEAPIRDYLVNVSQETKKDGIAGLIIEAEK